MVKKTNSPFVYSTDPNFTPDSFGEEMKEANPLAQQKVKISLTSKHRGGKSVTLITHVEGAEELRENIAKQLKAFCGTGGASKDGEIIIQGDNRQKVLQWLHKKGYTAARIV